MNAKTFVLVALNAFLLTWMSLDGGQPTRKIVLRDEDGRPRIEMSAEGNRAVIEMRNANGKLGVRLLTSDEGRSSIILGGRKVPDRIQLEVSADGSAALTLRDPSGFSRGAISVSRMPAGGAYATSLSLHNDSNTLSLHSDDARGWRGTARALGLPEEDQDRGGYSVLSMRERSSNAKMELSFTTKEGGVITATDRSGATVLHLRRNR